MQCDFCKKQLASSLFSSIRTDKDGFRQASRDLRGNILKKARCFSTIKATGYFYRFSLNETKGAKIRNPPPRIQIYAYACFYPSPRNQKYDKKRKPIHIQ